ncbi:MAG TPA: PHP domain-containing protein, partial [Gammaproteobacteria bacterium]
MSASPSFVHLRVHSEYSLVDSVLRVPVLLDTVQASGMPAVALTDQSNLFAAVKFYRRAVQSGIKPILGADLWIAAGADDREPTRLTLLCMNRDGYRNLSRLLTRGYSEGQCHGRPQLLGEWLRRENLDGLIALSGGQLGELGRVLLGAQPDRASEVAASWQEIFPGRFFVEVQRVGRSRENDYLGRAVALASREKIPLVATNDVCF